MEGTYEAMDSPLDPRLVDAQEDIDSEGSGDTALTLSGDEEIFHEASGLDEKDGDETPLQVKVICTPDTDNETEFDPADLVIEDDDELQLQSEEDSHQKQTPNSFFTNLSREITQLKGEVTKIREEQHMLDAPVKSPLLENKKVIQESDSRRALVEARSWGRERRKLEMERLKREERKESEKRKREKLITDLRKEAAKNKDAWDIERADLLADLESARDTISALESKVARIEGAANLAASKSEAGLSRSLAGWMREKQGLIKREQSLLAELESLRNSHGVELGKLRQTYEAEKTQLQQKIKMQKQTLVEVQKLNRELQQETVSDTGKLRSLVQERMSLETAIENLRKRKVSMEQSLHTKVARPMINASVGGESSALLSPAAVPRSQLETLEAQLEQERAAWAEERHDMIDGWAGRMQALTSTLQAFVADTERGSQASGASADEMRGITAMLETPILRPVKKQRDRSGRAMRTPPQMLHGGLTSPLRQITSIYP